MPQPVRQTIIPLQIALGALLTKSVGSVYRIHDIQEAHPLIQKNIKHREAVILVAATMISLLVQAVLSAKSITALINKSPIARFAILFQSALMAGALCLGELAGRYMTPMLDWRGVEVQIPKSLPGKETIMGIRTLSAVSNMGLYGGGFSLQSKAVVQPLTHKAGVAFGQKSVLKLEGTAGIDPQKDQVQRALSLIA